VVLLGGGGHGWYVFIYLPKASQGAILLEIGEQGKYHKTRFELFLRYIFPKELGTDIFSTELQIMSDSFTEG